MKPETMIKRIINNVNNEYCKTCLSGDKCCETCENQYCMINYEMKDIIESVKSGQVNAWEVEGALAFLEGFTGQNSKFFLKKERI